MSETYESPLDYDFIGLASPHTGNTTISNDPVSRLEREIQGLRTEMAQKDQCILNLDKTIEERDAYILVLETSLGLKLAEAVKGREEEIQQLGVDQGYQSGLEDAAEDFNRSYDDVRSRLMKTVKRAIDDIEFAMDQIRDLGELLPTKLP